MHLRKRFFSHFKGLFLKAFETDLASLSWESLWRQPVSK